MVLREHDVVVRWNRRLADATDLLAAISVESRRFFDGRSGFVRSYRSRRSAYDRLTGLASASVELHPHQLEAIRRVLSDPVQRYLLADEVGLGKTIEAGALIRQHLIDQTPGRVLVLAPDPLITQWAAELDQKFHLSEQFPGSVDIISFTDFRDDSGADGYGLVVVDEAHRIAAEAELEGPPETRYENLRLAALQSDKVILLSATPLTQKPASLHRLLHLLSPTTYPLDDLPRFERALRGRDEIATYYANLHPESPTVFLRTAVDGIRSAFSSDTHLQGLLADIEELLEVPDGGALERSIRRARAYIAEAYRVYDRMIRTRRGVGLAEEFPVLGRLEPTVAPCAGNRDVTNTVESWRELMAISMTQAQDQPDLILAIRNLLEAAYSAGNALEVAAQTRLATMGDGAPSAEETALLHDMVRASRLRSPDCPRISIATELAMRGLQDGQKVAIAVGTESGAEAVVHAMSAVKRATTFRISAATPDAAEMFTATPGPAVIVLGPAGEEGQNLQAADMLVHVDLPLDPNRLEQRLGRFDRFGAGTPARQVVVAEEDAGSHDRAWLECLRSGFGIFTESIASVQFVVDSLMPMIVRAALLDGPSGLMNAVADVRASVADELARIELAEMLDETAADERGIRLLETTEAAESGGETDAWAGSVIRWAAGDGSDAANLRFAHKSERNEHTFAMTSYDRPTASRLDVADLPLIPLQILAERFAGALDENGLSRGTFRRLTATRRAIRLLAPGDPFVDALWSFTDEDDRGRSFATWRPRTSWAGKPELAAFRFDVSVAPDITDGLSALGGLATAASDTALRRRAESYLPPLLQTVWLDHSGAEITDKPTLALLDEPHSELQGDTTLRPWLWAYVDDHVPRAGWAATCESLRDRAISIVLERHELLLRCEEASAELSQEGDDAAARLRARREQDAEQRAHAALELAHALAHGIRAPVIEVDAAGIVVLTSNPLPQDETR